MTFPPEAFPSAEHTGDQGVEQAQAAALQPDVAAHEGIHAVEGPAQPADTSAATEIVPRVDDHAGTNVLEGDVLPKTTFKGRQGLPDALAAALLNKYAPKGGLTSIPDLSAGDDPFGILPLRRWFREQPDMPDPLSPLSEQLYRGDMFPDGIEIPPLHWTVRDHMPLRDQVIDYAIDIPQRPEDSHLIWVDTPNGGSYMVLGPRGGYGGRQPGDDVERMPDPDQPDRTEAGDQQRTDAPEGVGDVTIFGRRYDRTGPTVIFPRSSEALRDAAMRAYWAGRRSGKDGGATYGQGDADLHDAEPSQVRQNEFPGGGETHEGEAHEE